MGYKELLGKVARIERDVSPGESITINMPNRWDKHHEGEKLNGKPVWVSNDLDGVKIHRIGKDGGKEYRDMTAEEVKEYEGGLADKPA